MISRDWATFLCWPFTFRKMTALCCIVLFFLEYVTNQSAEKGEVERVTEEIPFALDVWMNYYPFLLFTKGTASWWITAPQLGTEQSSCKRFHPWPLRQHPRRRDGGGDVTPRWREPQSVAKLVALTVIIAALAPSEGAACWFSPQLMWWRPQSVDIKSCCTFRMFFSFYLISSLKKVTLLSYSLIAVCNH